MTLRRVLELRPHRLISALGEPIAILTCIAMRMTRRKVGVALLYHRVAVRQGDPARELVPAIGAALFDRQVRHLQRHYRLVPASKLVEATRQRRRGERFPAAITFDDDDPSYTRITAPLLQRRGAPATFYLSGASLEAPFCFWFEDLQQLADRDGEIPLDRLGVRVPPGPYALIHRVSETVQRLPRSERAAVAQRLRELVGPPAAATGMRRAEVAALVDRSFEIGFHTRSHEPLATLDDESLARELAEGRAELEALAGAPITTIAYPFGVADARVADAALAAGFQTGYTTEPTAVRPEDNPLLLGRLLPSFHSLGHFALQIARRLALA